MKRFSLLLLSAFLTACSYNAFRPEPKTAAIEKPAPAKRSLTPADYMTDQENELKRIVDKTPFRIVRENNILALILSGKDVFSSTDQALSSDVEQTLKTVAGILSRYEKTRISIIGYADSGNPPVDRDVSEKRAQTVGNILKSSAKISDVRFWIEGSNSDISASLSEEERKKNNHVDIILTPTFIR